jgi:polysaccharide pyruvyl transferase WcaK-like protein
MSKIVISGYYGFNNAGDEALLTAILAALRAVEPTVGITVISGNPGNTIAKHQVKSLYRFAAVRLLRAIR